MAKMESQKQPEKVKCEACQMEFKFNCQLKYHIRKHHFNLVGNAPRYETQQVDDVWVETVANSDDLVEITKSGENVLLIKKVKKTSETKPAEQKQEVIDVRHKYPLEEAKATDSINCRVCQQPFNRTELGNHFSESHGELVKKRCDVCDVPLKSLMQCALHICPAGLNKKLKKENDKWIVVD